MRPKKMKVDPSTSCNPANESYAVSVGSSAMDGQRDQKEPKASPNQSNHITTKTAESSGIRWGFHTLRKTLYKKFLQGA